MRVVIFSGTTEGRALSAETAAMGADTVVCVATEYGKVLQEQVPGTETLSGRLDAKGMEKVLQNADLCIDATHPYAKEASKNIFEAAKAANVPYHRLLRKESDLPKDCILVDSASDAAGVLETTEGNILLTTGAKELTAFSALDPKRLYPRVLPTAESLAACETINVPKSNVIAMQGPFSYELNLALLRQFSIRFLITKDGGKAGGFFEKVNAAKDCGVKLIVIRRPKETGETYEEILAKCKEMMACSKFC